MKKYRDNMGGKISLYETQQYDKAISRRYYVSLVLGWAGIFRYWSKIAVNSQVLPPQNLPI